MMRRLLAGAALLLVIALAGLAFALQDIRLAAAAAAIGSLAALGIVLRGRRSRGPADVDRSRFTAARVSCTEKDGIVSVALVAADPPHGRAPSLLLSRVVRPPAPGAAAEDHQPRLELSEREWCDRGGIQDAHLSPRLLRLTLGAGAAQALGVPEVCVTLQAGLDQRLLERALRRVLRGVAFLSERSAPEDATAAQASAGST